MATRNRTVAVRRRAVVLLLGLTAVVTAGGALAGGSSAALGGRTWTVKPTPDPAGANISVLETIHAVRRSRAAGERSDRVRIDFSSAEAQGFDVTEYQELGALAREGLDVVSDAPPEHRAELLELAAFADFLVESTEALRRQWEARRGALRASGELPS